MGHDEGRYNGVPDGVALDWLNVVQTKVKSWVRLSPSTYSIRLYSSRHGEKRHNHTGTPEGQQRNILQGERNAYIHTLIYSFITQSSIFLGRSTKTQNAITPQPKLYDAVMTLSASFVCTTCFS